MPHILKARRGCATAVIIVVAGLASVVVYINFKIRNQYPVNAEFYAEAIGMTVDPGKVVAECSTAPWYGTLDFADFYVVAFPPTVLHPPPSGFPRKLDYQRSWTLVPWKRGPAPAVDWRILKEGTEFAIRWLRQEGKCPSVRDTLLSVPSLTDRTDIWYTYAYNDKPWLDRFSLYVIDPSKNVFYVLRYGI